MPKPRNDSVAVSHLSETIEIEKNMRRKSPQQSFLAQRPGHLESTGTLHIKTRAAQRHFLWLLTFAKQVKEIYRAAKQDDPYADARLIQIEQALESAQIFLQEKTTFYQQHTPASSSLLLPLADTKKPLSLPVRFTTPYGHIAARVLIEFDTLARCIISLYHWGLLAEMPLGTLLRQLSRPLYRLWETTKNWQPTGLTRAALLESITLANEETPSLKDLDPRVFNKEQRAKYAPQIFVVKQKNNPTEQKETP
jgi:integrating conjugative element protein (TIGR03761 family)